MKDIKRKDNGPWEIPLPENEMENALIYRILSVINDMKLEGKLEEKLTRKTEIINGVEDTSLDILDKFIYFTTGPKYKYKNFTRKLPSIKETKDVFKNITMPCLKELYQKCPENREAIAELMEHDEERTLRETRELKKLGSTPTVYIPVFGETSKAVHAKYKPPKASLSYGDSEFFIFINYVSSPYLDPFKIRENLIKPFGINLINSFDKVPSYKSENLL